MTKKEIEKHYKLGLKVNDFDGDSRKRAIKHLKKAADAGHLDAQLELGRTYQYWDDNGEDGCVFDQVVHYYELAANQGSTEAKYRLGKLYFCGCTEALDTCPFKPKLAYTWLAMAADEGHDKAQLLLSQMYADGEYFGLFNSDGQKALYYCNLSAKQDNAEAFNFLGALYLGKKKCNIKKNIKRAIECFEESGSLGFASSYYELGTIYSIGYGVKIDLKKSFKYWMLESKIKENEVGDRELPHEAAVYNLGLIFLLGLGTKVDYKNAKYYFEESKSSVWKSAALTNLGFIYAKGLGVKIDYSKAIECWQSAIKESNCPNECIYNLWRVFSQGIGTKTNKSKANTYLKLFYKSTMPNNFKKAKDFLCHKEFKYHGWLLPTDKY